MLKAQLGTATPSQAYQGTFHWDFQGKRLVQWTLSELNALQLSLPENKDS